MRLATLLVTKVMPVVALLGVTTIGVILSVNGGPVESEQVLSESHRSTEDQSPEDAEAEEPTQETSISTENGQPATTPGAQNDAQAVEEELNLEINVSGWEDEELGSEFEL